MKSKQTIKQNLRALHKLINSNAGKDCILIRIAYAMESAIRWAAGDTLQWTDLVRQAKQDAELLRRELAEKETEC